MRTSQWGRQRTWRRPSMPASRTSSECWCSPIWNWWEQMSAEHAAPTDDSLYTTQLQCTTRYWLWLLRGRNPAIFCKSHKSSSDQICSRIIIPPHSGCWPLESSELWAANVQHNTAFLSHQLAPDQIVHLLKDKMQWWESQENVLVMRQYFHWCSLSWVSYPWSARNTDYTCQLVSSSCLVCLSVHPTATFG